MNPSKKHRKQKPRDRENDKWGDDLTMKSEENIRISFQNVNGLYADDGDDNTFKTKQIYNFMKNNDIDVHALVELNVNWKLMPKSQSINELARGWFENQKVTTSYNMHDRICKHHQPGGTAIISQGELALRWMGQDSDPSKMG